jgi:hypothetical protein
MHPAHIAVTVFLGLCGLGAVLALSGAAPHLLGISFYLGWFATVGAMLIAAGLAGVLAERAWKGTARAFLRRSWLGLANGVASLMSWAWVIAYGGTPLR